MKRVKACLALLLAAPLALAQRPGVDAFFDAMAITVAPGQQSRYVVGDNVAGYFEGYTQSNDRGEGYVLKNGVLFQGYAGMVDGVRMPRRGAREQVLPYGHKVSYPDGGTEELTLLSKKQALVLRLHSPRDATLALELLLKNPGSVKVDGNLVTIEPGTPGGPFLTLVADRAIVLDDGRVLRSVAPGRSLTVIAAFGDSAAAARKNAAGLQHEALFDAERAALHAELTKSYLRTSDASYNKALNWAKASSRMFVVEEFGTGIWAGLPWFRDNWGRDTFIALPGTLLVSGQFPQARDVLLNFARFQNLKEPRDRDYGRIPNRVAARPDAANDIIYNTVDGTPWMLREAIEYIRYTGDMGFAQAMHKVAVPYFDGAIANYVDADGLLRHDSADTWMDARIENKQPWSARGPRAVEIQALWYTALQSGATLADQAGDKVRAVQWRALAAKAQQNFLRLYWDGKVMADRLREDGSRDTKVRPNQLMLASIPFDDFVPAAVQARVTKNAVSELLYPYGIASLSQNDPYFHPRHENPAFHHKDAAYHQGTIWGWNAGYTVTALNKFGYQDLAWRLTQNLGAQILGLGTLGTMSELLDALPAADGALTPSGTFAQSWSVAEYARNGYQDYIGFRPNLLENNLAFSPAIPAAWREFDAVLPYAEHDEIALRFERTRTGQRWRLQLTGEARTVAFDYLNADKSRSRLAFPLEPGKPAVLELSPAGARLNGTMLTAMRSMPSQAAVLGKLRFQTPRAYLPQDFPMLKTKDALKGIVERNEYR
ncbi:MAG: amylo-alpha-1,6-glucosidase [Pseudomonadota bacterium]